MFIIFPIGRKSELTTFPWATCALIALNIIVFLLTWPAEKRFLHDRVSHEEYTRLARELTAIITQPDSGVAENIKKRLLTDKESSNFPTPFVEEIFESINTGTIKLNLKTQYSWGIIYPRYTAFKTSLAASPKKYTSVFYAYGFSLKSRIFPNIVAYQFLHAGILHIFFNMLFLWLVGCNVEDRWGPVLFLLLFIIGGIAAALVQGIFHPDTPMIGSSGSVAAIMGAFLIRHAVIKIRFVYLLLFFVSYRAGVFYVPAWVVLPLWFFQQLFFGMMSLKGSPQVGYWAHAGGFACGILGGILIKLFHLDRTWEEKADRTLRACDAKISKAFSELYLNNFDNAEPVFSEVLNLYPDHNKARRGLVKLYAKKKDTTGFCRESAELAKYALQKGDIITVNDALNSVKDIIEKEVLPDSVLFKIAVLFEKTQRWKKAVQTYSRLIDICPKSHYVPKALFAAGKIMKNVLKQEDEAKKFFEQLCKPPYDLEWKSIAEKYLQA